MIKQTHAAKILGIVRTLRKKLNEYKEKWKINKTWNAICIVHVSVQDDYWVDTQRCMGRRTNNAK